jgi:GNAT superfamily N-acetyltransferase
MKWDVNELAGAADENLVMHASWVQRHLAGMHVSSERGLVTIDSGLPCDTFNIVCGARLDEASARDRVRQVVTALRATGRPFTWWVGPADRPRHLRDLLIEAGLAHAEREQAMAAPLVTLRAAPLAPDGLRIEHVRDEAPLRDFARVVAANWTPPDELVTRFYELATPLLLRPDCPLRLYVGYLADLPVAASELTVGGGVVGLYNVCTLAAYRRRGFGGALTLRPLLDARAEGHAVAVLQASAAGAGIYARLGFTAFGSIDEYKLTSRPRNPNLSR